MAGTIQISARHLYAADVDTEVRAASTEGREISDACAVTLASYWQSPGTVGYALTALASGAEIGLTELLDDIHRTRQEITNTLTGTAWTCWQPGR